MSFFHFFILQLKIKAEKKNCVKGHINTMFANLNINYITYKG